MLSRLRLMTAWVVGGVLIVGLILWFAVMRHNDDRQERSLRHYKGIVVFDIEALDVSNASLPASPPFARIDENDTAVICEQVTFHEGSRLWKGSLLGVVELDDGTEQRIAISYYGGFFKVLGEEGYYQTHGQSRIVLEKSIAHILSSQFIPRRHGRAD